jgi:hypothetical protein
VNRFSIFALKELLDGPIRVGMTTELWPDGRSVAKVRANQGRLAFNT